MAALRQFRLLHTTHVERGENGEMIEYHAGDIVHSKIDLTKRFLNRFQEVIPTTPVVEAEAEDEEEEEAPEEFETDVPPEMEPVMDKPERLPPIKEENVKKATKKKSK